MEVDYFDMKADVKIRKKFFFCQTNYFMKILKCFQMFDYQSVFILMNQRVANSLFFLKKFNQIKLLSSGIS